MVKLRENDQGIIFKDTYYRAYLRDDLKFWSKFVIAIAIIITGLFVFL